jgi:hypothetical protein
MTIEQVPAEYTAGLPAVASALVYALIAAAFW